MFPKKDLRVKRGSLSICTSNPCVSQNLTLFVLWRGNKGFGSRTKDLGAENGLEKYLVLPFTEDTEGQRGS